MSEYRDAEGYPTEKALNRIEKWPPDKEYLHLMAFLDVLWTYKDCFTCDPYNKVYTLRTAGWSGNESLISALQANTVFWTMCWLSSHRGGKHVFEIRQPWLRKNPESALDR